MAKKKQTTQKKKLKPAFSPKPKQTPLATANLLSELQSPSPEGPTESPTSP